MRLAFLLVLCVAASWTITQSANGPAPEPCRRDAGRIVEQDRYVVIRRACHGGYATHGLRFAECPPSPFLPAHAWRVECFHRGGEARVVAS